ncbi:MAG: permease-like cell division protein FtsX [Lachnospiraceae bacterium]|nr:permease-like cell division protein FtsX [Lachnospiraceae bacterium]
MKINTFFYTIKQGFLNIFRNKMFSLASIATIGACLFLFGLFYGVVMNVQHIVRSIETGVSVSVLFDEDITPERIAEIGDLIDKRPEVAKKEFISADEAWAEFSKEYLGEYADGFPENPLEGSDSYNIYMADISMQPALVSYLQSIQGIRQVNYSEMTASTLTGVNEIIVYISAGIIAILLAVSVFLISNTVTIGISVRREEISIMKYIGATDYFVRSPFVIEGMLIGAIGAFIPDAIIYFLYGKLISYVKGEFSYMPDRIMTFLTVDELFRTLLPVSFAIGVGIGFFGSIMTVRKHLRV